MTDQIFRRYARIPRFGQHEIQSPVPSQDHPQAPAFNPSRQPDIPVPVRAERRPFMNQGDNPGTQLTPQEIADVRSVFDSRPVSAFDFYWEDCFFDGLREMPAYTVPKGFTCVIRSVNVAIFAQAGGAATMTDFGDLNTSGVVGVTVPQLQMHVDGAPTPMWTQYGHMINANTGASVRGVPIYGALIGCVEIPCFIVVPGGSTFSIFIPNFIDNVFGLTFHNTYAQYYGNMLPASGKDVQQDVASQEPMPVTGA